MFRFVFLMVILVSLMGCYRVSQLSTIDIYDGSPIASTSIPTTGSFEVFSESSHFNAFKNKPGCALASGENNSTMVSCYGTSGYNYLY